MMMMTMMKLFNKSFTTFHIERWQKHKTHHCSLCDRVFVVRPQTRKSLIFCFAVFSARRPICRLGNAFIRLGRPVNAFLDAGFLRAAFGPCNWCHYVHRPTTDCGRQRHFWKRFRCFVLGLRAIIIRLMTIDLETWRRCRRSTPYVRSAILKCRTQPGSVERAGTGKIPAFPYLPPPFPFQVRDNYNRKSNKYVCIATYQPDTKSNPNPNPTTKQHAIVNI